MLKLLALIATLLTVGCAFDGIQGSGRVVTKDIPSGAFDRVQVDNSFHVDVTRGPGHSLTVSVDDNLWDYVDIYNLGGILHVGMKSGNYQSAHLSATIALPRLSAMEANGASSVVLHGIDDPGSRLEVRVGGASNLDGEVNCGEILLTVSGAGTATLRGSAEEMTLEADSAARARLEQFRTRFSRARVSGAADVAIFVSRELEFDVSGAAHFSYAGHPIIRRAESSGASAVHSAK